MIPPYHPSIVSKMCLITYYEQYSVKIRLISYYTVQALKKTTIIWRLLEIVRKKGKEIKGKWCDLYKACINCIEIL